MSRRTRNSAAVSQDRMLAAARELLVAEGPAALTLARVAAATGTGHPNVLHHFGSAAGLRRALLARIVADVGDSAEALVIRLRQGGAPLAALVDALFDGFAENGLGRLMAWAVLEGEADALAAASGAVADRIARLAESAPAGGADRVRLAAQLLIGQAFADAIIGEGLATALARDRTAIRTAIVTQLAQLSSDQPAPSNAPSRSA